jgi:uncharacterized protein YjbI with pentapeptide repeats
MRNANLAGVDLTGADLTNAYTSYTNMTDADLSGAITTGVNLSGNPAIIYGNTTCPDGTNSDEDDGDNFTCINNTISP